jgi:hypothetical protein
MREYNVSGGRSGEIRVVEPGRVAVIPWELSLGDCHIAVNAAEGYRPSGDEKVQLPEDVVLELLCEFSQSKRVNVELLVDGRFVIIRHGKIDA